MICEAVLPLVVAVPSDRRAKADEILFLEEGW
jgi:hypothetical protein